MENAENIYDQMDNDSTEMEILKKNQREMAEIKNTIKEMNTFEYTYQ